MSGGSGVEPWLSQQWREGGAFTLLVVLVQINDATSEVLPVKSTWLHVTGRDVDWPSLCRLLDGAGLAWQGVVFFPARNEGGGPLPDARARERLRETERAVVGDRMAINQGHFFDRQGRRMRVEEWGIGKTLH